MRSMMTDSNAATPIASRRGQTCGVHVLVAAGVPKSGRVKMRQVSGEKTLAHHLTKGKSWRDFDDLIRGAGVRMKSQRGRTQVEEVAGEVRPSRHPRSRP